MAPLVRFFNGFFSIFVLKKYVIIIIITIIIINIILIIIIIIAIICINIVNIGKISFTSLYIQLDKSLALTIGAEKELLFFGGVNYSVDEVLILPDCSSSSETQGQSVEPREKAPRKFSSTGGRAPGYRLSSDHFQMVMQMLASDWAQKKLWIIVLNRWTIFLSSFREFVHDGYYVATLCRFVHQACAYKGNFHFLPS